MAKKHAVILGAGISGLALAWHLKKFHGESIDVTVVEKSSRAGGWIRTVQHEGFLFEEGPRSCRTSGSGVATLQLIEELQLTDEVITASAHAHRRFLYIDRQLQQMPQGLLSFLCSPLMRGILPMLWKEWKMPAKNVEEESIYDFFARRFSPDIAEKFIDPMVSGIYAGDMRHLSLRSCFPLCYRWEQEYGSLVKGMIYDRRKLTQEASPFVSMMQKHSLFSFKKGMETLIKALYEKLRHCVVLNRSAETLKIAPNHVEVSLTDGQSLYADKVFLAIPAEATLSLFQRSFPALQESLPQAVTAATAASVAVVSLGWRKNMLQQQGFGYLVPSKEEENILGVVWDSSAFPQQNGSGEETRLTVMLGGKQHPLMADMSDEILLKYALDAVIQHLKIESSPQVSYVCRAKKAIPQYELGHSLKVKQLEEWVAARSSRLTLLGSAWYGVAVNDSIAAAKEIALRQ